MLSLRTIEPHTLELLKAISSQEIVKNARLVGGTSLALQYGHRQSVDLDFFSTSQLIGEELHSMLDSIGKVVVLKESTNINIYTVDGVKVDFVNYKYNWIDSPHTENGITLATDKDIAAMKINAIEGRGTKKDFIDLFVLLQHYSLHEILHFYEMKYPDCSIFRALLSLTYFEDAEEQMMPKMFIPDSWEEIKASILSSVMEYQ